ncbi:MAG: hypothetical protein V7K98_17980 [Nostoc sp.]|uniref:hypothetical protein n=1 Tax=Nostoc sp. TaxID=1180 RepID=UPI002FF5A8CE
MDFRFNHQRRRSWWLCSKENTTLNDLGKYSPNATAKERQRIVYLTGILNKNGK